MSVANPIPHIPRRLALNGEMSIYHAAEQKTLLIDALAGSEGLELDLSGVTEMDTAGLQLLVLLKREARCQGKDVVLLAHSQAVREVIDFCNMSAELGDPMVIPAREA